MKLISLPTDLIQVSAVAYIVVLLAMLIDLGSGIYKAKLRGELRTSQALKRTLSKFISYEGGMVIATFIDVLIYFCKMWQLFGMTAFSEIPLFTCLVGIFLLIIEWMSVREKADQKTKNKMNEVATAIMGILEKKDVKEALAEMIKNGVKQSGQNCNTDE